MFDARLKKLEAKLTGKVSTVESRIEITNEKVETLTKEVKENRVLDIYSFADQSERADYASNLLKINSVLITGIHYYL